MKGGASIWDAFTHTPGKIAYGDHGDIACDSYRRYEENFALLKELGGKAYRFSASWARIDPRADGSWNHAGIAYYDAVVAACPKAGIEPCMTRYTGSFPRQRRFGAVGWLRIQPRTSASTSQRILSTGTKT